MTDFWNGKPIADCDQQHLNGYAVTLDDVPLLIEALKNTDDIEEMIEPFREDVRIIADADFWVCCIIQGFNRAPIPTGRESYVNKIVSWVFAPDEQYQQGG